MLLQYLGQRKMPAHQLLSSIELKKKPALISLLPVLALLLVVGALDKSNVASASRARTISGKRQEK